MVLNGTERYYSVEYIHFYRPNLIDIDRWVSEYIVPYLVQSFSLVHCYCSSCVNSVCSQKWLIVSCHSDVYYCDLYDNTVPCLYHFCRHFVSTVIGMWVEVVYHGILGTSFPMTVYVLRFFRFHRRNSSLTDRRGVVVILPSFYQSVTGSPDCNFNRYFRT